MRKYGGKQRKRNAPVCTGKAHVRMPACKQRCNAKCYSRHSRSQNVGERLVNSQHALFLDTYIRPHLNCHINNNIAQGNSQVKIRQTAECHITRSGRNLAICQMWQYTCNWANNVAGLVLPGKIMWQSDHKFPSEIWQLCPDLVGTKIRGGNLWRKGLRTQSADQNTMGSEK